MFIAAPLLEIQIDLASWRRVPRVRARAREAAEAAFEHLPKKSRFPATATLLLTGNGRIRQLNRDFRSIDRATNVLSFPQFSPQELARAGKEKQPVELGDIAIAYQYMVAESKKDRKILINHLSHLVIHGFLHLFGYDHTDEGQAMVMERLETKIMYALGLPDPYAENADMRRGLRLGKN